MFQINSLFLRKFGWTMNMWDKEIPYTFIKSSNRIYGILYEDNKVYFIKSTNTETIDHGKSYFTLSTLLKQNIEEKVEIVSNGEMVNVIKKNEACVKDYQRHFKLSSILNNNNKEE